MRKAACIVIVLAAFAGGVAQAQPADRSALLDGAFWKKQGLEQVLPPWTARAADAERGAYFAELSRDWTPNRSSEKYPGMIGRHVFSYAAAYLMSGEEAHLRRATGAFDFMVRHGWDERHGGWYNAVSRAGAVTDSSKDVFMQVYAATGLALYYAATRSERARRYLERTNRMLETHAWDAARGGYVRSLRRDLSVKETFKDFSPQLAPLSGYLLFMYQATREEAYLRQAERVMDTALEHMRDAETGWVLERFGRDWQFLSDDRKNRFVNVGHNIEVAWVLLRLHLLRENPRYKRLALALSRQLTEHAFHEETGAWAHRLKATRPSEQLETTPWWVQAYGNMLQLYLYRVTGDESALERFRKGARFWNEHFVDARYGGTVLAATLDGALARGDKGVRTKTSYHAMEHALLNYLLTNLWVEGRPATLHFRIADAAPGERLYPSLLEGEQVHIRRATVNGEERAVSEGAFVALLEASPARVNVVLEAGLPSVERSATQEPAQPAPADSLFDLVIFGEGFEAGAHRAFLQTNPGFGEAWEQVGTLAPANSQRTGKRAVVLRGLSRERYVGQDIRENALAFKITSAAGAEDARLSAVYVVPHAAQNTAERLRRLIRDRPLEVRQRSLASYVRPRPARLQSGASFVENVEAPVCYERPGEAEVEWLEVLFSGD